MTELRRTVGLLRTSDRPSCSAVALDDVAALVAAAPGVTVTTDIRVQRQLPTTVDAAAYRIIQEAVTNIAKHSTATRAAITVRDHGDLLEVEVSDDGRTGAEPGPGEGGLGLAGMRERATALGGTLEAGPDGAGFRVRATLPVEELP